MSRYTLKSSLYVASALGALASTTAFAQPNQQAPAATPQTKAATEAVAGGAEEIVVTARRKEELLQDVPISITVFNQDQLTNRNIVIASDLGTYTPSLAVNQRFGPEKATFAIRG